MEEVEQGEDDGEREYFDLLHEESLDLEDLSRTQEDDLQLSSSKYPTKYLLSHSKGASK